MSNSLDGCSRALDNKSLRRSVPPKDRDSTLTGLHPQSSYLFLLFYPYPLWKKCVWFQAMLVQLGITTAPKYRINGVAHPGRVEYRAIAEIFYGSRAVISRHQGPAFRASSNDAMANAAWQTITSWSRSHQSKLQNTVHRLIPQWMKEFMVPGVKKDIPRMEMVHYQDVTLELSTRLLAA
jgi:hypothetical protein